MVSEGREYCLVPHEQFCYYPRADYRCFASLYAYNSATPVLRIQHDNLAQETYPQEQGMLFIKPVNTELPVYSYDEGEFFLFVRYDEPNEMICRKTIEPMLEIIEKEGYEVTGDVFAFLVMGDAQENKKDLTCFEFEVKKV